jgi:hypothetical protein
MHVSELGGVEGGGGRGEEGELREGAHIKGGSGWRLAVRKMTAGLEIFFAVWADGQAVSPPHQRS